MKLHRYGLILALHATQAIAHDNCLTEGLELLQHHHPKSMIILHSVTQPNPHLKEITCNESWDQVVGLATLIHESVHDWDHQESSSSTHIFHLNDGEKISIAIPKESLPRSSIIPLLNSSENTSGRFAENYLYDQSGSQGLISLLDEINAYTHSLEARIHLPMLDVSTSEAAGLLASIDFLIKYYRIAEINDPEFFSRTLMAPNTLIVVKNLMKHAFEQLEKSKLRDDVNLYRSSWEKNLSQADDKKMLIRMMK